MFTNSNKRVLLLGASGFIGSHVYNLLKETTHTIWAPTRTELDINTITSPLEFDIIFHAADYSDNTRLKSYTTSDYQHFLENLQNLINLSPKETLFMYCSSWGVFSQYSSNNKWQQQYNDYKLLAEEIIKTKDNFVIYRFPYIYSKRNIKEDSIFDKALNDKLDKVHTIIPVLNIEKILANSIKPYLKMSKCRVIEQFISQVEWIDIQELKAWMLSS